MTSAAVTWGPDVNEQSTGLKWIKLHHSIFTISVTVIEVKGRIMNFWMTLHLLMNEQNIQENSPFLHFLYLSRNTPPVCDWL